jgi:hypothetical protein
LDLTCNITKKSKDGLTFSGTYIQSTPNNWEMPRRPLHTNTHGNPAVQPTCVYLVIPVLWGLPTHIVTNWVHNQNLSVVQNQILSPSWNQEFWCMQLVTYSYVCTLPFLLCGNWTTLHSLVYFLDKNSAAYMQKINSVVNIGADLSSNVKLLQA